MFFIGNHVSSSKGFLAMGKLETMLGGNVFAFFTRNPRGGNAKEIEKEDVMALLQWIERASVWENCGTCSLYHEFMFCKGKGKRVFYRNVKRRFDKNGVFTRNYYNFHPGSHVGQGVEKGIHLIADALNQALTPEQNTKVLLETMAGKGTEIGGSFEELKAIIDLVERKDKLGVCMDTCHVWDGGYDIVNDLDGVLQEFDQIIGLKHLYAIHFNDSMNERGSHKDRHEKLGMGKIGMEAMKKIALHPKLARRPFILETPNDDEGYAKEIAWVKSLQDE